MEKPPRVVAELGRPETPEEAAARRAEATRKRRSNQTVRNLVFALAASLGIVLVLVLVVVRPDQPPRDATDWETIAAQYQPSVDEPLTAPRLPPEWTANNADLETGADDIPTWYIGFLTPGGDFIGLRQGVDADARWLDEAVDESAPTGTVDLGGVEWLAYDRRESNDPGNYAYSQSTVIGRSTFVLFGTASDEEFALLATAVADGVPSTGASASPGPSADPSPSAGVSPDPSASAPPTVLPSVAPTPGTTP